MSFSSTQNQEFSPSLVAPICLQLKACAKLSWYFIVEEIPVPQATAGSVRGALPAVAFAGVTINKSNK